MNVKALAVGVAMATLATSAAAHVSYSGRDYLVDGTFDGSATYSVINQRVTSAFGWADAADADWGDSHRGRFARFTLTSAADVTIKVWEQDNVTYSSGGQTLMALNDMVPAFSLYGGVLPGAAFEGGDHPDFRATHPGYLPTISYFYGKAGPREGAWNALATFDMSNKLSEQAVASNWKNGTLTYVGHAIDGTGVDVNGDRIVDLAGDGSADRMVSQTFRLGPGTYSVVIGGACYACQYTEPDSTWGAQRGFSTSLTLQPVPEPGTWVLMGAGLALLGFAARRRAA